MYMYFCMNMYMHMHMHMHMHMYLISSSGIKYVTLMGGVDGMSTERSCDKAVSRKQRG